MTHIAITAGGTSEPIDGIRKITNISTGRLAWQCLNHILLHYDESQEKFKVHYIHTETAYREEIPSEKADCIDFIEVSDTQSVYEAVDSLTKTVKIDYFIHSMAISDFTFDYAVNKVDLADEIWEAFRNGENKNAVLNILNQPNSKIIGNKKISSKENIFLSLKKTKKVISLIKKNNEKTCLVGFKLLKNVSESELQKVATRLAQTNDCDYVFANELSTISEAKSHTGILMHKGEIIARPIGKKEIAEIILNKIIAKNSSSQ